MSERTKLTDTGAFHDPIDGFYKPINNAEGTVVVGIVKECKHPKKYFEGYTGYEVCPDCGWSEDITN